MDKEIRAVSCSKCNPKLDDPDYVSGYAGYLKYLLFGRLCRVCKSELVDLGVVEDGSAFQKNS